MVISHSGYGKARIMFFQEECYTLMKLTYLLTALFAVGN